MEQELTFKNWKCRCSQLGNIMTNLEGITTKQLEEIDALLEEKATGLNKNGNKIKWTENKANKLSELLAKRDKPDELPAGAISYLEEEFRSVFWGRRRILNNKYIKKGLLCEEDALQLLSDVDGEFYVKNDEQLENEFLTGCPDNREGKIRDTKANYDMDSFDKADLSKLYEWQIKGYLILDNKELGELDYTLVNNPLHQLQNERKSVWYAMGQPEEEDPEWTIMAQQIERNMIFDKDAFREQYPTYDFENSHDFSIPRHLRVKKFEVRLEEGDREAIERRVKLAREWLVKKEIETRKLINLKTETV